MAAACALLWAFRSVLAPFALAFVIAILIASSVRALGGRLPGVAGRWARSIAGLAVAAILLACAAIVAGGAARTGASVPRLIPVLDRLVRDTAVAVGLRTPLGLDALAANLDAPGLADAALGVIQLAVSATALTALFLVFIPACRPLIGAKLRAVAEWCCQSNANPSPPRAWWTERRLR